MSKHTYLPKFNLVVYHANCFDGTASAWAFYQHFGETAAFVPFNHGEDPPDVSEQVVAIVDFSFPKGTLVRMAKTAKMIVVLDHHKSAERDLQGLDNLTNLKIVFDMNRSGAQIAWDYLNPTKRRPWFIDYIGDRDLWRHKLVNSREINQTLHFDNWGTLERLTELFKMDPFSAMSFFATRGVVLLEYREKDILKYVNAAKPAMFTVGDKKYTVGLVCGPRDLRSDVGAGIAKDPKFDFAAIYFYDFATDEWYISLRAAEKSPHDLSKISAQIPGGGGHPGAAGFSISGKNGNTLKTFFTPI